MRRIAVFALAILGAPRPAAADFTAPPGRMAVEEFAVAGDLGLYHAGIEGFDADAEYSFYLSSSRLYRRPWGGEAEAVFAYDSDVYGAFVRIHGDRVYFGESSYGTVRSLDRAGAGPARLHFALPPAKSRRDFVLPYNYDCAFNRSSEMFVSANPDFSAARIYFWSGAGEPDSVAVPGGYSGPLAAGPEDELYYGCYTSVLPTAENVVFYRAGDLRRARETGRPLGLLEARLLARGAEAPGALAISESGGHFLAAANTGKLFRLNRGGLPFWQDFGFVPPPAWISRVSVNDSGEALFAVTDWSTYSSAVYRMDLHPLIDTLSGESDALAGGWGDPGEYSSGIQAFDFDAEGNLYVFAETRYLVKNPGFSSQTLYEYPESGHYGSFVKVYDGVVYFGDSTSGEIRSVAAQGGTDARLLWSFPSSPRRQGEEFNLPGNFDAAFDSQGRMFISANPGGWEPENRLYFWSEETGPIPVVETGGMSGALTVGEDDYLYYGFADQTAPQVVRFSPGAIEGVLSGGPLLTYADGEPVFPGGFRPCTGLAFAGGDLYCSSYDGAVWAVTGENVGLAFACADNDDQDYFGGLAASPGGGMAVLCTNYRNYNSAVCEFSLRTPEAARLGIFRPDNARWVIRGLTRLNFGTPGDREVFADYDGEGAAPAVFRPGTGLWRLRGLSRFYFGAEGDEPVPAEFSAVGRADPAVFRSATGLWAVRGLTRFHFGKEGDRPLPGDWHGAGVEAGIFRPLSGLWALGEDRLYFGREDDLPLAVDPAGTGKPFPAVFRPATGLWSVRGLTRFYFGREGDVPLAFPFSGTGSDDFAVFRPSAGLWLVRGLTRFYLGREGDLPVVE